MAALSVLSPRLFVDLIGKPYRRDARGPAAYDCLGLAIELQRRQGRAVPDFESTPAEFARAYTEGLLGPCRQIASPEPGCVVLVRMLGGEHHLGTMIDVRSMLHTTEGLGVAAIESLRLPLWDRRVRGYYVPEVR